MYIPTNKLRIKSNPSVFTKFIQTMSIDEGQEQTNS